MILPIREVPFGLPLYRPGLAIGVNPQAVSSIHKMTKILL